MCRFAPFSSIQGLRQASDALIYIMIPHVNFRYVSSLLACLSVGIIVNVLVKVSFITGKKWRTICSNMQVISGHDMGYSKLSSDEEAQWMLAAGWV